jgi:hypothetical protein
MGLDDLPVETVLHLLFGYTPSKPAAIAAVVMYAIITVAVAAVTLKTRTYYMLTVVVTGILELIGAQGGATCTQWAVRGELSSSVHSHLPASASCWQCTAGREAGEVIPCLQSAKDERFTEHVCLAGHQRRTSRWVCLAHTEVDWPNFAQCFCARSARFVGVAC